MKLSLSATILFLCLSSAACGQSKQDNFDFNWRFIEQDVKNAQDAMLDDSKWKRIDLPHDWDIYHAPAKDAPSGNDGGYFPGGIGWYRKQVKESELKTSEGETIWLHFEGVYQNCQVYVNGEHAGGHAYGYTPFKVNITPFVKKAQTPLLCEWTTRINLTADGTAAQAYTAMCGSRNTMKTR